MGMRLRLALYGLMASCCVAAAEPPAPKPPPAEPPVAAGAPAATETGHDALCRIIDAAAREHGVEADFLTNLIWRESSFRAGAVSRKGAQGIAQFMPYTAAERGLADPFDPEQAIPQAARLIADLRARFGNLGLAAAAYNAGPARVEKWLAKEAGLPAETRNFVALVTGRAAEDWAAMAKGKAAPAAEPPAPVSCAGVVVALRRPGGAGPAKGPGAVEPGEEAPFAPWGVQLAGNFSKDQALASFARARAHYATILGDIRPMVIGTRLLSRGTRAFYRVRVPAESRAAADALCGRIRAAGGSCVALKS